MNKTNRIDKMRYQLNKSAYWLVLLSMVFQTISLFMTITPRSVIPTMSTAVEILINILLLLVTFLAAEKVKAYSNRYVYGLFGISAVHLFRVFNEPLKLLKLKQISSVQYTQITILIGLTILFMVYAALITLRKYHELKTHLKEIGE
ncbi:hypothetical protein N7603_05090 [Acholeplasma vituli]|uniref:DUF3021 domain-containing protein n=1 Tax=Paracholeplasma vituli TaxID=69473 RepID=A0ABT2PVP2_9MOLU|nr:hypothetical protein [Paracholeplasma vituli]MCU0105026.1 hypothetical protein [Paracholeplasma vituli]